MVGGDAAQRAQAAAAIAGGSGSTELLGDFGFVYIRALARIHAILMSNVLTSGLRHFYGFRFWKYSSVTANRPQLSSYSRLSRDPFARGASVLICSSSV